MTTRRRFNTNIGALTCTLTLAAAALLVHAQATQPGESKRFTTPGGVEVVVIQAGEGAKDRDVLWVHFTGKLTDGTKFDSSYDRGEPINLVLGEGRVIAGWEQGLRGMRVGEKRTLTIPPELAYGAEGRPPKIPANATLVFDLELMGIQRK